VKDKIKFYEKNSFTIFNFNLIKKLISLEIIPAIFVQKKVGKTERDTLVAVFHRNLKNILLNYE